MSNNFTNMLLIDRLTEFADASFQDILSNDVTCTKRLRSDTNARANQYKNCSQSATSTCSQDHDIYTMCQNRRLVTPYQCECCLEEIHFAIEVGAEVQVASYLCPHICYVYTCKYIHKYASEIMFCLEQINFTNLQSPRVLAFGCGPSPELCALDYLLQSGVINNYSYTGVEQNSNWNETHNFYLNDPNTAARSQFYNVDAREFFNENITNYDIIIMSNMLSDIVNHHGKDVARNFLEQLRNILIATQHFPILIFNDINIVFPDRGSIDIIWEVFGNLQYYPNKICQAFPNRRGGNIFNYQRIFHIHDDNPLHQAFSNTECCVNYGPFEFVSAAQIILQP